MSRSFRRRPFAPLCGGSQKYSKRVCNRVQRRHNRVALGVHGDDAAYITKREALDVWVMPQDGTRHYAPHDPRRLDDRAWYRWVLAK